MGYVWLRFKECGHGTPWPCVQPAGYISCGDSGWTLGIKSHGKYPYQIIGSDNIFSRDEFDKVVPLKEKQPK